MNISRIRAIVEELLKVHGASFPVDVELIAEKVGVEIKRDALKHDLSGFAYQKFNTRFIGVNDSDGPQRQRFTIAHELGHLFLHKQDTVSYDQGMIMLRDNHSSDGTDIKEIEANRFAAELLMPEKSIQDDVTAYGSSVDLLSDSTEIDSLIDRLATKYNVSNSAMRVRLTTLYFN